MPLVRKKSLVSHLLGRWYWVLAILLTVAVWLALGLALYPLPGADGKYASSPYGLNTGLENKATDLLFQLRDVGRPSMRARGMNEPIVIIEIDEQAIKASGVRLQKWRRDWYARLIERANRGGASVIGLDVFLGEEGGSSAEDKTYDQLLSKAMADAGNVVIAGTFASSSFPAMMPLPQFSNAAYTYGFVNIQLDSDGFIRSSILLPQGSGESAQVSFPTRVAETYLAARSAEGQTPQYLTLLGNNQVVFNSRPVPLRNDGTLQLDFRTRSPAFRRVSAAAILFNDSAPLPDDLFRDRIVLIGATNIDAPDLFPTPFYEPSALVRLFDRKLPAVPVRTPGIELHATTVATLLFGQTLVRPSYRLQLLLLVVPIALCGLGVFRLRALWGLLSVILIAAGTLATSSWAFNGQSLILPLASAWLGLAVLTPLGLGLRYAHERVLREETEAERAELMDILSRCVSSEVASELWESRDQIMSGERRSVSLVFTDIRSFTTLSESASSDQIVVWLNDYFSRMHAIVTRHGGHINKFLGDGLMIVFGAPASRGDETEARAAVACGLEMLAEVGRINLDWKDSARPTIKIGVGIHSGEATCGVVGAERRLEYTVIGDTVNLASRLESLTKEYGVPILVSDATARLLDQSYEVSALGEVKVKGKNESTKIFSVETVSDGLQSAAPRAT